MEKQEKLTTIINREYLLNYVKNSPQSRHLLNIGLDLAIQAGQTELTRVDDYIVIVDDQFLDLHMTLSTKIYNNPDFTLSTHSGLLQDQVITLLVANIQELGDSEVLTNILIYAQYLLGLTFNWRQHTFYDLYKFLGKFKGVEVHVLKNQLVMLDYCYDLDMICCPDNDTYAEEDENYPDSYLRELYNF